MVRLFAFLATLVVVGLLSGVSSPAPTGALNAMNCEGTMGAWSNLGEHPYLWPYQADLSYTPLANNPDGSQDFAFTGTSPMISVTGTRDADGNLSGTGTGQYSGFNTGVDLGGMIRYYDEAKQYPRYIWGWYDIGPDGELPGGEPLNWNVYCYFLPPLSIADPDGDFEFSAGLGAFTIQTTATGRLNTNQTSILVRKDDGTDVLINLQDPTAWESFDDKGGPLDTTIKRKFNSIMGMYGGAFSYNISEGGFDLPPELLGPQVNSVLSGYFTGSFELDGISQNVKDFDFNFSVVGNSFPVLNGAAHSGSWRWYRDLSKDVTGTVETDTGQFSLSVPTLLYMPNIKRPLQERSIQGGDEELQGAPLEFTETVTGQFPGLAAIGSLLDNCPDVANVDQADTDTDGIGDACEGAYWADPNCSTRSTARDAVHTLLALAGDAPDAELGCPAFGDSVGGFEYGDWDCNGTFGAGDVLVPLKREGNLTLDLPQGCPQPGDFVPE